MKYTLKLNKTKLEGLRLPELEGTGAQVCVRTKNSLYKIEFRKDGTVTSGGKIGKIPISVQILGTGSLFSHTLYTNRIDACGCLEFNVCCTSPILRVTIEAPRRVIRKALFNYE